MRLALALISVAAVSTLALGPAADARSRADCERRQMDAQSRVLCGECNHQTG